MWRLLSFIDVIVGVRARQPRRTWTWTWVAASLFVLATNPVEQPSEPFDDSEAAMGG